MFLPSSRTANDAAVGCPRLLARRHLAVGNRWQAARELHLHLESCVGFAVLVHPDWDKPARAVRQLSIRRAVSWLVQHGVATPRERFLVLRAQRLLLAVLSRTESMPIDLCDVFDIFVELQDIADSERDGDDDDHQVERIDA